MATENTNVVDGKIVYTPGTHWTQTPEGRERLSRMTRERAAKRGLVPKGPGKHWECTTCKVQCNLYIV